MSSLGHQLTTSVLVVGSGASGLRAAIEVAEAGVAVVVVTQRAREGAPASAAWDHAEWPPPLPALATPGSGTRLTRRGRAAYRPPRPASGSPHAPPRSPSKASNPAAGAPAAPTACPPHGSLARTVTGPCVCAGGNLVQFHPFGLIEPDHAAGMPLSDGARHAGGVLLNNLGERFMTRYDPERMELSAQETVARASYTEIQEGRGSRSGGVWLDLSHLPGDTVLARLPHSPAATRAAEADVLRLMAADGDHHARALQRAVRRLITNHAGVVRDKAGPVAGLTALDEIEARTADTGVHIDIGGFSDLAHAYDLRSAVLAARATLQCARVRLCPQGCHHRSGRPGAAPALQDAMVWSATTGVRRTSLWPAPTGITVPWRDASDDAGPTV